MSPSPRTHGSAGIQLAYEVAAGSCWRWTALRYQDSRSLSAAASSGELMSVKLRFKAPDGDRSELLSAAERLR